MAIGIVATFKVQEGKREEFEAVFKELAKAVRTNEPGNKFYQLCKSREDKNAYVVMEIYENDEAVKAHGEAKYLHTIGARLGPTMAGTPDVQYFDVVA